MVDKHGTGEDPDCYPGTSTLVNLLKIEDNKTLENAERENLIPLIAEFYGDLNMIQPFREGNGRTQRILFEHIIINAGFEIFWEPVNREQWVKANTAAVVCNYRPLEEIFDLYIGKPLVYWFYEYFWKNDRRFTVAPMMGWSDIQ